MKRQQEIRSLLLLLLQHNNSSSRPASLHNRATRWERHNPRVSWSETRNRPSSGCGSAAAVKQQQQQQPWVVSRLFKSRTTALTSRLSSSTLTISREILAAPSASSYVPFRADYRLKQQQQNQVSILLPQQQIKLHISATTRSFAPILFAVHPPQAAATNCDVGLLRRVLLAPIAGVIFYLQIISCRRTKHDIQQGPA